MISKERIVAEIDKVPEKYFEDLYKIIKNFEVKADEEFESGQSLMSSLRQIKISASPDFSMKANLYSIEKKNAQ